MECAEGTSARNGVGVGLQLIIPLGGQPGPLFAFVHAVCADPAVVVARVFVIITERGAVHLAKAAHEAWDSLRASVSHRCPEWTDVDVRVAGPGDGTPDATAAIGDAVWQAFGEAVRNDAPVVCALGGGRHRAVAATVTSIFSVRARQRDQLVDVGFDDRDAERHSGFLFPAQPAQRLHRASGGVLVAASVGVRLDAVPVPRLRRVIGDDRPGSFSTAMSVGQRALDAMTPPQLVIDLAVPEVRIDDVVVTGLNPSDVLWLATLAVARQESDGWVASDVDHFFQQVCMSARHHEWCNDVHSKVLQWGLGVRAKLPKETSMNQWRSRALRAYRRYVKQHLPQWDRVLLPSRRVLEKTARYQLPLDPTRIRIEGRA